jgi:hypothetical protein
MPLSQAQIARNHYAGLIRQNSNPIAIEQARQALEVAKAEQAVASWSHLALMQRARLAAQLLAAGADDAIAT